MSDKNDEWCNKFVSWFFNWLGNLLKSFNIVIVVVVVLVFIIPWLYGMFKDWLLTTSTGEQILLFFTLI